jgi:putative membrane protein
MHIGNRYTVREFLRWTRYDSYWILAISTLPVLLYQGLGWRWLSVPWVPIAMIGTAAAFIVGFKNNATYDRLWEARRIWGGIVNSSRSWGMLVHDFIQPGGGVTPDGVTTARRELVYRHLAWLTALRYQLRQPRSWEGMLLRENADYRQRTYRVAEQEGDVLKELAPLLSAADLAALDGVANRATHLVALQSRQLAALAAGGAIEANRHVALQRLLQDCYDLQGQCERIKNFPYPRQFATVNHFFVRIFMWLLPLGVLHEFDQLGSGVIWLSIPFSFVVGWVFNALDRVGQSTESPFEGSPNDVPITTLARTIEIDLRQMLGETEVPRPLEPVNQILM